MTFILQTSILCNGHKVTTYLKEVPYQRVCNYGHSHQVHVYLVDTMVISDLALTPSGVDALSNTKVTFLLNCCWKPYLYEYCNLFYKNVIDVLLDKEINVFVWKLI